MIGLRGGEFTTRWMGRGSRCYNRGMSGGEAFSRVKIDGQIEEAGWAFADGRRVRYECTLADGMRADYVLRDRGGEVKFRSDEATG